MSQAVFVSALEHFKAGRLDQALAVLQRAGPKATDPQLDYLHAWVLEKKGDRERAIYFITRACEKAPGDARFPGKLGAILYDLKRYDQAKPHLLKAAALSDKEHSARSYLAAIARSRCEYGDSEKWYKETIAIWPEDVDSIASLSWVLAESLQQNEAIAMLEKAVAAHPSNANLRISYCTMFNYLDGFDPARVRREHEVYGGITCPTAHPRPSKRVRTGSDQRLRIGYVSPDFREHSCAKYAAALLRDHDRTRVHVSAYHTSKVADEVTRRLAGLLKEDEALVQFPPGNDAGLAEKIRSDGIDVLVDLAGLTTDHRQGMFGLRPAAVQLTYLGYPNTTGLRVYDGRVVDHLTDPSGTDDSCTEPLQRLGRCFLAYTPAPDLPEVTSRPGDAPIRFVSFNLLAKVSEETLTMWAAVLHAVPGSTMLIKARSTGDESVRQRLLSRFAALGISSDRIETTAYTSTAQDHLKLYQGVDIGLDTYPYNGTTTTCEALSMGIPVITRGGATHASRVGTSLVNAIGYPTWAATDRDGYVAMARSLAADRARLAQIRSGLRTTLLASSLCDGASLCRELEHVYEQMWNDVSSG
jgi:predicted O-linked N-acetylglucosamine transferase (SPINDLY family)